MRRTAGVAAICLAVTGLHVNAQISPLRFRVGISQYCGEAYTPPPQGGPTFVYIQGERIRLRLAILNFDRGAEHQLVTSADSPESGFQFSVTRDLQPVTVALRVLRETMRHERALEFMDRWSARMNLPADAALSWWVDVGITEPGPYRLVVTANATDEASKPVHFGEFNFEVRAKSADTELESIRRDACYALQEGRHEDAESAARNLLKRYPQSSEAHMLLGQIADARKVQFQESGNVAAAQAEARLRKRHYADALNLLTSGADAVYLQNANLRMLEEHVRGLSRLIAIEP